MRRLKIIVIQPGFAHYRKPLFSKLHRHYDAIFLFLSSKKTYPSVSEANEKWNKIYLHSTKKTIWFLKLFLILLYTDAPLIISSIPTSLASTIAFIAAKLRKKKFIIWSLNWNFSYEYLFRPNIYRSLKKLQYKYIICNSDAIIEPGDYSLKYHKTFGINEKKIFVGNQCSIDLEKGISIKYNNSFQSKKNKKIILYFSRITPRKGLDILIKAFKKIELEMKNVKLHVVGEGRFKSYCEDLAQKINLENIRFFGSVPFENASNYYINTDIFVLPSCLRGHCEAWGLAINEAMSMGKPIITTDAVGASFDLVKNGYNGYIVRNGNVNDLYHAMKKILENQQLLEKMGKNSRKIFEIFNDYEKMFKGFKEAILYAHQQG